ASKPTRRPGGSVAFLGWGALWAAPIRGDIFPPRHRTLRDVPLAAFPLAGQAGRGTLWVRRVSKRASCAGKRAYPLGRAQLARLSYFSATASWRLRPS